MSKFKEVTIMELKANVNFERFEAALQVVDAHTVGEFCRVVIGGFPEPEGSTMIEKKKWMEKNYDQGEVPTGPASHPNRATQT